MISVRRKDLPLTGEIRLPSSKSISNRLLILQYSYGKGLQINNISNSDDTLLLSSLLNVIRQYQLGGAAGILRIDTRNAGSVMRFLIPLLAVSRGHYLVTGSDRMKFRPVGPLVDAIRVAGAEIDYLGTHGYAPFIIRGRPLEGGRIKLDASVSSQFATALLLLAPTMENGLTLELTGRLSSWPYIRMTIELLKQLGVQVIIQENSIRIFRKYEIRCTVDVEQDWSSASFWYLMLSMACEGELFFPDLQPSGLQGDMQLEDLFFDLGIETRHESGGVRIVRKKIEIDAVRFGFDDIPDLALPVICAAAATGKPGYYTGLERLRIKESDRIDALVAGLKKTGVSLVEVFPGNWRSSGPLTDPCSLFIDDFGDHRVAMTFAALAVKGFYICLEHPEAVNKSYPGFWNDLKETGFECGTSC